MINEFYGTENLKYIMQEADMANMLEIYGMK